MLDTEWPDSWRAAFRIELRAEAIGLAWRGWPVIPGTYPDADPTGASNTTPMWTRPTPAHSDWKRRIGAHPQQVAAWWTGRPYSLLVATGTLVDALEVDDRTGRRAAVLLRATGQPAPIVAMPNGRWLFLTAAADRLPRVLSEAESVEWHGEDSWVPLPPTPFHHGVVHWRVKPDVWGWKLPRPEVVHDVLVRALREEPVPQAEVHRVSPVEPSAA
ncbi:bifunctional DNA primase/polymerase [Saccharomonospora cyanea]|uniref:Bifunctional DNA primase/polymerase famiily protein n=1 Tax=Saccharomonospora cyanea NA-134 TaxID=882082 RepID=H5XK89_9PSEU|nr:bifunctional DNA primase/polymerase [Saccharomonospora cyanea]EHR63524.1 bifunctional DNA primase/polymerase famiily protein [Saccharomonospora cyanea NA-134]